VEAKTPTSATFIEDEKADILSNPPPRRCSMDKIEQVLRRSPIVAPEIIKLRYGIGTGYTYTLEEWGASFR